MVKIWILWYVLWMGYGWLTAFESIIWRPHVFSSILIWSGAVLVLIQVMGVPVTPEAWIAFVLGMSLATWARLTLGTYWHHGISIQEGHRRITSGPYAFIWHPMYIGFIIAMEGTAILAGTWPAMIGLSFFTLGLAVKAYQEDVLLDSYFGEM